MKTRCYFSLNCSSKCPVVVTSREQYSSGECRAEMSTSVSTIIGRFKRIISARNRRNSFSEKGNGSIVTQGDHRVHAHGAPRRNVAGQHRDARQNRANEEKRDRVVCADTEE